MATTEQNNTTLVFVYGTLKTGMANHKHKMIHYPSCKLLAQAKTVNKYPLIIAGERKVPYLFDSVGIGHQIEGEIYRVAEKEHLEELDTFEGCDTGHYNRITIHVHVTSCSTTTTNTTTTNTTPSSSSSSLTCSELSVGSIIQCHVYMRNKQPGDDEFLKEHEHEMIPSFTSEHDQFYQRAADHVG